MAVVPSPGVIVTVAESLISDLGRVSEWCDLWGMKLNASKTKTMIVSRLRTMYPQSPPLIIGGTVLTKSDDLDILGMTFDSKMTFEKHLQLVARAASQRLGIFSRVRCNPMHLRNGALPGPYVPVRVTRGALVVHQYTYAPPRCRTLQYRITFIPLSVSLWNDSANPVFDGV